jgi:geranylgeranyl pyrophosphate synthase
MISVMDARNQLITAKVALLENVNDVALRGQLAYALHGASLNRQWGSQSRGLLAFFLADDRTSGFGRALAVELMHNAALIVDDLIDKSTERRINPSFWVKYGTENAVLVAHILVSMSLKELLRSCPKDKGGLLFEATLADISIIAEAELRAGRCEVRTASEYLAYAFSKTGRLFERAAMFGLDGEQQHCEMIAGIGKIGLLHQLVDDAQDQRVDRKLEGSFAQCNWMYLAEAERRIVLDEIRLIVEDTWPRLQKILDQHPNGFRVEAVLQEVGQFAWLFAQQRAVA